MYLNYYQLAQKPFQINTDPAFLWFGEKHKEALATLRYGLHENKSFLLLTGDIGVGKTTVVNALLQLLDSNVTAVAIHDPGLEKLDFFNYIASEFDMPGNYVTKGSFINDFRKFLLNRHYQGGRVLLIIDESQLLTQELLEEIRLFSNLEKNGVKLINIFFVGQMEFNEILLRPENKAIRQRITVSYNINPLNEKETAEYIEFRLAVAGAYRKIFDKAAIREIYNFSNGYPRLINVIADRGLLTAYIKSVRQINKAIIQECARELDISVALPYRRFQSPVQPPIPVPDQSADTQHRSANMQHRIQPDTKHIQAPVQPNARHRIESNHAAKSSQTGLGFFFLLYPFLVIVFLYLLFTYYEDLLYLLSITLF
jgi:general secretion pathway protein A